MAPDQRSPYKATADPQGSGALHTPRVSPPPSLRARQFTLRRAFVFLTIAAALFALAFYARQLREKAQWVTSGNDFKQVALALWNFNDVFGSPPYPVRRAGGIGPLPKPYDPHAQALYSWRFAMIEYVAKYGPGPNYGASWNGAANAPWRTVPHIFAYNAWDDPSQTTTKMFAITGPDTAFGDGVDELPHSLEELDADTILVVEVRDSGVHWMAPGDFDIRTMPRTINAPDGRGVSSRYPYGFHVIFADGAVWCLSHETPFEELEKFFTIEGAKRYDRHTVLGQYTTHL